MKSVDDYRKQIDKADSKILRLLSERMRIVKLVGRYKKKNSLPIFVPKREKELFSKIEKNAFQTGIDTKIALEIFEKIVSESRKIQEKEVLAISFQGEFGAYSHQACLDIFGKKCATLPCKSFSEALKAVEEDDCDAAVIPVENTIGGLVDASHDLLIDTKLKAVGEYKMKVHHCLLAKKGETLETIRAVYSHPQALAQCKNFLEKELKHAKTIPYQDTASSAKMVSEQSSDNLGLSAIASNICAQFYDLSIIKEGIEDDKGNTTRFLIFAKKGTRVKSVLKKSGTKTSIVFSLKNKPGSLFGSLKAFADQKINLTRIASRPDRKKNFEYVFYTDFDGSDSAPNAKKALKKLEKHSGFLKVLGSYPVLKK